MNGGVFPTSGTAKDLGASGAFRWNNFWVSTISSIHIQSSTIGTRQIATDRIVGGPTSVNNTFTNNLFPNASFYSIGYGSNTAQGGYYQQGNFRSTFTNVIQPATDAGQLSNVVRVNGILSTNTLTTQFLNGAGPIAGTSVYTTTLLPNGSVNIGNTGNNFYQSGCFNSTFTQVIQPRTDASVSAANSNVVRINGFVSTQNVFVSTINRKQYPTRSTIGGPFFPSSFTIDGTTATTPQLLISSINFYAGAGNYDISQRMAYIKLSGGASVDAHGSILVASTNTLLVPDSNAGYGQVPQVNDVGHSTFNTFYTSITVGTNSFERQYKYLDTTGGNYTGSLYLERPVITYIPSQGLNPE
jgi:hypothetical protein